MFLPLVDLFADDEVTRLFSEESIVGAWLDVESALAQAQAELGIIPIEAAAAIDQAATTGTIELPRLRERTVVVGYPILPLLEQVADFSPAAGRHLHWGATTQDIMDTGLALVLGRVLDRTLDLVRALGDEVAGKADAHRGTVMPGRTHAQPAVPITFGGKLAVWLAELTRHTERLRAVRERAAVVQLFGAAGTAAALGPQSRAVRHGVAERLGLGVVDVPWHTARDSLAEVGFVVAATAGTCGKLAREVIELSRPEIGEVREEAGSSAGRVVDHAAEGESGRQRGSRRARDPGGASRGRAPRGDAGHARACGRRVAGRSGMRCPLPAPPPRGRSPGQSTSSPDSASSPSECGRTSGARVARSWRRPR